MSTKYFHVAITDVTAPRRNSAQTSDRMEIGPGLARLDLNGYIKKSIYT